MPEQISTGEVDKELAEKIANVIAQHTAQHGNKIHTLMVLTIADAIVEDTNGHEVNRYIFTNREEVIQNVASYLDKEEERFIGTIH